MPGARCRHCRPHWSCQQAGRGPHMSRRQLGYTMCRLGHVIIIISPWSWLTLAPTAKLSTLPLLMSGTMQEAVKSSITNTREIYDTDHNTGAQGGSRGHQPDRWFCNWDQRMSSPPHIYEEEMIQFSINSSTNSFKQKPECDNRMQSCLAPFKPSIGQYPRGAAVYF